MTGRYILRQQVQLMMTIGGWAIRLWNYLQLTDVLCNEGADTDQKIVCSWIAFVNTESYYSASGLAGSSSWSFIEKYLTTLRDRVSICQRATRRE